MSLGTWTHRSIRFHAHPVGAGILIHKAGAVVGNHYAENALMERSQNETLLRNLGGIH
jgi:hypothetical protein